MYTVNIIEKNQRRDKKRKRITFENWVQIPVTLDQGK